MGLFENWVLAELMTKLDNLDDDDEPSEEKYIESYHCKDCGTFHIYDKYADFGFARYCPYCGKELE